MWVSDILKAEVRVGLSSVEFRWSRRVEEERGDELVKLCGIRKELRASQALADALVQRRNENVDILRNSLQRRPSPS